MSTSSLLSLLWWVGIGLFFFWMMRRGGCGMSPHRAGSSHSHEEGDGARLDRLRSIEGKPIDPVCGMPVDPVQAFGTRVVEGHTYFFCSQTCLDTFDKHPDLQKASHRSDGARSHQHAGC